MAPPDSNKTVLRSFPVVGIGTSAGGLEALSQVFRALPGDTGMAFLIVQHLDPNHESILTELLSKATPMPVAEAAEGSAVEPNRVYVIPPGKDMRFEAGGIRLVPRVSPHMPVDSLFRSIAEAHLDGAVGVVLSGTGSDGAAGVADIHAQGGITIVQDPAGAKFDGMPRSAIATGCVSVVLPTEGIAEELARISRLPGWGKGDAGDKPDDPSPVLDLLQARKGVDFSGYKKGTITRRIVRRMVMGRLRLFSDYAQRLKDDPAEVDRLYDDVLIRVTRFFRDEEEFRVLKDEVFPELLKDRTGATDVPIRIWVAGCATGEEAYTFAMCAAEFLEERRRPGVPVQIFGTDLSEKALLKARAGLYPEVIEKELSPERLRRFFKKVNGHYQVNKSLREACIFAKHDILSDPPFSKVDIISCRNVLIYLSSSRQKRLLPLFHFSLNPRGWLVLGTSETVGSSSELFTPLSRSHRIFVKNPSARRVKIEFPTGAAPTPGSDDAPRSAKAAPEVGRMSAQVERALIHRYAPAGVVINERSEIVQFRGDTSPYLAHAPGEPSLKLFKLVKDGLRPHVDEVLTRAKASGALARKEGVLARRDGEVRAMVLEAIPVVALPGEQRFWVVTFEETPSVPPAASGEPIAVGEGQELASMREHLEGLIDEKETINQDLQAAHEEVLSTNEELQSINEELQTAKEELQSANEELNTMNGELHHVNDQSLLLITDLNNLLESVDIPVVIVDGTLRVRRFTTQAREAFNLIPGDVGRPIGHLRPRLNAVDLEKMISASVESASFQEQFLQDPEGRWRSLRVRPYKTAEGKVDGAVITVLDVDALKRSELRSSAARDYAEDILHMLREPFLVLDRGLKVLRANPSFYRTFGLSPSETENRPLQEVGQGQWSAPEVRSMLEKVAVGKGDVKDFELRHGQGDGTKYMLLNASRIARQGKDDLILLAVEDQTERRRTEKHVRAFNEELERQVRKRTAELTAMNQELESFSYSVSHDLRTPLRGIDGFSRILLKRYGDKMDEEGKSFFQRIRAASQRMSLLINGLLSLSRLTRRPMRRDRVDLSAMAASIADELLRRKPERHVRFIIPPGIVTFGDEGLIRAALENLIGNAWKFTGKRPEAEIELGRTERDAETVYFIRDNGVGFEAAYAEKMFEAFQRLHTSEEFPGTGIGLATVQRVIRRHGGRIWAEGEVGRGATFYFTFMKPGDLFIEEPVPAREEGGGNHDEGRR